MSGRVPAAVTPEELALVGPRLHAPQAYMSALLASAWRQELALDDILVELRGRSLPAVEPKPAKGKGGA